MKTIVTHIVFLTAFAALSISCRESGGSPAETISVSPEVSALEFGAYAPERISFTVTGPESWDVTAESDWVVVEPSASGFVLTCRTNIGQESRGADTVVISAADAEPVKIAVTQRGLEMYIAGTRDDHGVYWHDGQETSVSESVAIYPNGIYVTEAGEVHVVGRQGYGSYFNGFWWSSVSGWQDIYGSLSAENPIYVSSVCVDENTGDIYWSGYEGLSEAGYMQTWVAEYFKNGSERVGLTESGVSQAGKITLVGEDVYVLISGEQAGYAVNGKITPLEKAGESIYPSCMQVKDGNVYVGGYYLTSAAGEYLYVPCFWTNGKITTLDAAVSSQVYCLCVDDGGDVWLGGSEGVGFNRAAAYWHNGEKVLLTDVNNGCLVGIAAMDGRYVAVGFEKGASGKLVIKRWEDGNAEELTDGTANCSASDVFFM